ncbi:MAG: hypothetical protein JOZ22_24940 [Acidobacteriia bacterium]|nr:hypothetical protein [Terriglobia bacterium]
MPSPSGKLKVFCVGKCSTPGDRNFFETWTRQILISDTRDGWKSTRGGWSYQF